MNSRLALVLGATVFLAAAVTAGDSDKNWPAWRGPLNSGVAPAGDPPTEWSETKNVRWKVAIPGRGHATPIIWGDRVYVLTAIKTDRSSARIDDTADTFAANDSSGMWALPAARVQDPPPPPRGERPRRGGGGGPGMEKPTNIYEFVVLALDRKTGKTIWQKKVCEAVPHEGTHQDGTQASPSPVTDGQHIYAYFGSRGLYCLDLDGNVKWEKKFGEMRVARTFGEGASPALHGDTIVVNWDHEGDDFIVALNKKTGAEIWRKQRDEPTTWTTPLIVEVAGKAQVIVPGTKNCRSYDLATGETVWECAGLTNNVIPSPVSSDGMVYLMSGFRGASLKAVKLSAAKGNIDDNKAALVWSSTKEKTPYVPSPLLYGDCLYFFDNNKGQVTCLNARTGDKFYGPERLEGVQNIYASPVGAADRIYIAGRDGKTAILKRGEKFETIATNELDEGCDASPAIVGNELFLRGKEHLYCIAK